MTVRSNNTDWWHHERKINTHLISHEHQVRASVSFTSGIDSTYDEYQFWFVDVHT